MAQDGVIPIVDRLLASIGNPRLKQEARSDLVRLSGAVSEHVGPLHLPSAALARMAPQALP